VRRSWTPSCHRVAWFAGVLGIMVFAAATPSPAEFATPDPPGDAGRVVVVLDVKATHSDFAQDAETTLLLLINQCRAAHHIAPLVMNQVLRNVAREHSRAMALQGFAGHGSPLGQSFLDRMSIAVGPGRLVGENVVVAETVADANRAFTASAGHLSNMLDPRFRYVGIGVATDDTLGLTVTEDFSQ
jgi:uncharacterized protein YkwD